MLPTLIFGPRAGGRGYQLLADSGLPPLDQAIRDRLNAVPLALASWADIGEDAFIAQIPLGPGLAPALVLRARFLGKAAGGTVAFANAVFVPAEQAERLVWPEPLLTAIPWPDGSTTFAEQPLPAPPLREMPAGSRQWHGLGLAWQDRLLLVSADQDRESLLLSALASITPRVQRDRVRGWSTTAALPSSADFAPSRLFQLIVAAEDSLAPLPHLTARPSKDGFLGETVSPPASWIVWRDLHDVLAGDPPLEAAIGRIDWEPSTAAMAPHDLLVRAVSAMLAMLAGEAEAQIRLVSLITAGGAVPAAARASVTAYAASAPLPSLVALCAAFPTLGLGAQIAARFDPATLNADDLVVAIGGGMAEGLGGDDDAIDRIVGLLEARHLGNALDGLTDMPEWTARHAVFSSAILKRLASEPCADTDEPTLRSFPVALARCLDWTDERPVIVNLVRQDVVRAMRAAAGHLAKRYAVALLNLSDDVRRGDRLQFATARAALAWIATSPAGASA